MSLLPKLNLSRAVKIPNDVLLKNEDIVSDDSKKSITNLSLNSNIDQAQIIPESKEITNNTDVDLSESNDSNDEIYIDEQLLSPTKYQDDNSETDNNNNNNNTQNLKNDNTIIPALPSLCFSEENTKIVSREISLPEIKKRRRTVNKIDQDPEKLPLRDLLFYNPPETIFQKENRQLQQEEQTKIEPKHSLVKRRLSSRSNSVNSEQSLKNQTIQSLEQKEEENSCSTVQGETTSSSDGNQVLTIDESGNIVFKNPEQSTTNETKPNVKAKMKYTTNYNSFRRRERSKTLWNAEETGTFYTALEIVGTDFTLMEALFFKDRGRDRKQLKQKFKREEKINRAYIDEILFKSLNNRPKLATLLKDEGNEKNGNLLVK